MSFERQWPDLIHPSTAPSCDIARRLLRLRLVGEDAGEFLNRPITKTSAFRIARETASLSRSLCN